MIKIFLIIVGLLVFAILLVVVLFAWHHLRTRGLAYFGLNQSDRIRFKRRVHMIGRFLNPLFRLLTIREPKPNQFTLHHDGIYVPANVCNKQSFASAINYQPDARDVFVVTQMKCGTTWMQHIVYQVLMKGAGDLSDAGHGHLQAVSPWLESFMGPAIDKAPCVGESGRRIIKTHLPSQLCPDSGEAKFIYVTRHPASCFASCRDFFRASAGDLSPSSSTLLQWFCSEEMWWGSWPSHLSGWHRRSLKTPNVLIMHFENMIRDLPGSIREVAAFLGVELDESHVEAISRQCGFESMKAQSELFEMLPPNYFSRTDGAFRSGRADRYMSLSENERTQISEYCRAVMDSETWAFSDYMASVDALD